MITPGIDSICSYFYIIEKVLKPNMELELIHIGVSPLYYDIEKRSLERIEVMFLKHPVRYIDANSVRMIIQEDSDAFIPSRNLLLATLVDCTAIPDRRYSNLISFGFNADDRVYDSSDVFCEVATSLLSPNVHMGSLVRHLTKNELLKWFVEESVTLNQEEKQCLLVTTYSCYSGMEVECLKCNACFRKNVALSEVGIIRDINDSNFLHKRLSILKDSDVSKTRKENIISYLKNLISIYPKHREQFSKYLKENDVAS